MKRFDIESQRFYSISEEERLYSTGSDELDELMEKAFCEGYEYAQREFALPFIGKTLGANLGNKVKGMGRMPITPTPLKSKIKVAEKVAIKPKPNGMGAVTGAFPIKYNRIDPALKNIPGMI